MNIVQTWVSELGLRYQDVLVSAVRGCDTAPKHDASKDLARCFRAEILNTHVNDPKLSKSFIEKVHNETVAVRMSAFIKNWDHYPMHYVMHFIHAGEVLGYFHPDRLRRALWFKFYEKCCHKLHVNVESIEMLRKRLESDEDTFYASQDEVIHVPIASEIQCRHCNRPGCTGSCLGS